MRSVIFLLIACSSQAQVIIWDGGGSNNDWHNTCNWNPDAIPLCTDSAVVPSGFTVEIKTTTIAHCRKISLQGTAQLDIQGTGKLEVSDANSCTGTPSSSTVGCGGIWGSPSLLPPGGGFGCDQPPGSSTGSPMPVGSPCMPLGSNHNYLVATGWCPDCVFPTSCLSMMQQTCE